MKKIAQYIPVLLLVMLASSCLKSNLDVLPAYSGAEISNFRFEYRWIATVGENQQLHVVQLKTVATIDTINNIISCSLTVPAASTDFPQNNRDSVTLSNIVGYADISTAATMKPIADAPKLGEVADFSKTNMQYEITAADGKTKNTWNLKITGFVK